MQHIIDDLNVEESKVIIMGRSIGSGAAVEMGNKYKKCRSLVLISPFTSLREVVKDHTSTFFSKILKERFRNLEKMHRVGCPVLIIHGKEDSLIS